MNLLKTKRFYTTIDGNEVPMVSGRKTRSIYKRYFKKNLLKTLRYYAENYENTYQHNSEVAEIIWSYAKAANPNLPDFTKWVDSHERINVKEIILDIGEQVKQ